MLLENALPAAVIVFAFLSLEPVLRRRPMAFLAYMGNASYSMYLSHIFFLGAARFLWIHAGLDRAALPNALGFAIVGIALTAFGAVAVYQCLELPLLHLMQRAYLRVRALRMGNINAPMPTT